MAINFPPTPKQMLQNTEQLACELFEILCINCQDFILIDNIEYHSRHCTVVKPEVLREEAEDLLKSVSNRISKLYTVIFGLSSAEGMGPGAKNYLIIMQRLCGRLVSVTEISHRDENAEVIQGLEALTKHLKTSHNLVIYLERLKALAKEQKGYLDELHFQQPPNKELTLEEQLAFYKNKSMILEDALKLTRKKENPFRSGVDEVVSDTGSRISGLISSSASSFDSTGEIETVELEAMVKSELTNPDDEQKLFYSQCLSIKLALSVEHAVQSVPIQSIYFKARDLRVPIKEWPDFIKNEILSRSEPRDAPRARGLKRRFFPSFENS
eukprot:CAMPEP_0204897706 /NCGR_PEP_ID=MMETSP1397-20131031/886_1 /ASSEMBLY_ACC=CAM_ASM_000891 /TAXON_ID=49980 /ORGANISM="Climacostomum Climacostomum virens, Strain Stock W-24" /LENGTH=325 /DNA_ID=CAMNT_0052065481 /DNA_START=95 /DNA_END=1072 /DNA_ORIENTATION=-